MWQEDGAAGRQHIHNTLHLYQDGCLRAEQKRVFLKNLDETIDRLNQGKKVDSEQLREMHRYLVKKEPQHWMRNAAAVAEACRYMGNFVIRTNVVQDPFIALSIYRARNIVEQSFQQRSSLRDLKHLHGQAVCPGIGPVTAPDDAYGMSAQRNGNEPFAQQFFDEGLYAAALSEGQ